MCILCTLEYAANTSVHYLNAKECNGCGVSIWGWPVHHHTHLPLGTPRGLFTSQHGVKTTFTLRKPIGFTVVQNLLNNLALITPSINSTKADRRQTKGLVILIGTMVSTQISQYRKQVAKSACKKTWKKGRRLRSTTRHTWGKYWTWRKGTIN